MQQPTALASLSSNVASLPMLLPEVFLGVTIGVILILILAIPQYQRYWLQPVGMAGIVLAGGSQCWLGFQQAVAGSIPLFRGLVVLDLSTIGLSIVLLSLTLPVLLCSPTLAQTSCSKTAGPTYVVLVLGVLLGSCFLVMASHWLTIYLSFSLISLGSCLLLGGYSWPRGIQTSLQYLLYSMAATAIMLWGVGYLYGCTGSLTLSPAVGIELGLSDLQGKFPAVIALFCLSSPLFLLAITPYHLWLPSVYATAPPSIVAYLSTVPKLATIGVLWRLFQQYLPQQGALVQEQVQGLTAGLALLTLVVGHIGALLQDNLKRLLAYGAIAQGGLLLAAVVALPHSEAGLWYYSLLYGVTNLAAWLGLGVLQQVAKGESLQHWSGLGWQFPELGVSLTVVVVALIGLPPTAGFTGKLLLFSGLWSWAHQTGSFLAIGLLVASFLGTLLSAYYYLKLPYILFRKNSIGIISRKIQRERIAYVFVILFALLLLLGFAIGRNILLVV